MTSSRVTVVIPVFNAERYLGEAIESVLIQGDQVLEIIVVDDGSTDESAAVAKGFGERVQIIRQSNLGPAAARNRGLTASRAEYIAFLDADDLYTSDKFTLQLPRLDRHPEVDIVIGQLRHWRPQDNQAVPVSVEPSDEQRSLQMTNWSGWNGLPSFTTGIFRRKVFDRVGLLDESMLQAEDWDWFLRARETGVRMLLHQDVVLNRRHHKDNVTQNREIATRFTALAIGRSMARRRRSGKAAVPLPPLSAFFEPEEDREC
jgi:glycosyltransferase involved in cell wall biosynthesis